MSVTRYQLRRLPHETDWHHRGQEWICVDALAEYYRIDERRTITLCISRTPVRDACTAEVLPGREIRINGRYNHIAWAPLTWKMPGGVFWWWIELP